MIYYKYSQTGKSGAGFLIAELKKKGRDSYHLDTGHSIFTDELIAILMTLNTFVR